MALMVLRHRVSGYEPNCDFADARSGHFINGG